jgi:ParB/RepB/Spo0J family partition protein
MSELIAISQINVNTDRRQRREFSDEAHQELMHSLSKRGQLQPVVIERETYEILAGERRFRAAQALGWDYIECKFLEDLSEDERMLIQYDENIRREDIDWQSKALAVYRYHEYMATHFGHTQAMTAANLNMKPAAMSQYLDVAKALIDEDTMVTEADTFSVARGIVTRKKARQADAEAEALFNTTSLVDSASESLTETTPNNTMSLPAEAKEERDNVGVPFLLADFNEWQQTYHGPKFNLIHCDFPYGINTDKHDSSAQGFGDYNDTPETYFELLDTLESAMDNVVADSAHLIFWFSMDFYQVTLERLQAMGWRVQHFPLIWHKTNKSILPDPKRGPRRQYETAFLASRGDRLIVRATTNHHSSPATKDVHKSEKPREMLAHFMGMVCDETTSLLDPTMGSGNAIAVAEELGGRGLGLERNAEFYDNAVAHYKRNLAE